ncbi:MAG: GHMP kinase [Candidatus Thermoplasmatota archaeon]|nr:GHMP kinase [Candidatus Thermoplasmatota archaeon]
MDREAFCPGHVTGFFEIRRSEDLLSMGSRGAGLCLSLGATSRVEIEESDIQQTRVRIAGSSSRGDVTREALRILIQAAPLRIDVLTKLDLPMTQGFGMSAAGALSACLAVADLLGMPRQKAFEAAHIAEIRRGSGLGDVSAIHCGGITIRKKAGLPPRGEVLRINGAPEVVLAVVGKGLRTRAILNDPVRARAINASGSEKVEELIEEPSLEKLMRLSREFALETRLASREVLEAMRSVSSCGMASMSMLGSSVFAVGDTASLRRGLSEFGDVWVCNVDTTGPRILESQQ